MYEILDRVVQTNFDAEAIEKEDPESEVEFVMKDGRIVKGMMTWEQIKDMFDFIVSHEELSRRIKLAPIGLTNKDLK